MKLFGLLFVTSLFLILNLSIVKCGRSVFHAIIKSLNTEKSKALRAIENSSKTKTQNEIFVYAKMKKLSAESKKQIGCGVEVFVWDDVSQSLSLAPLKIHLQHEETYYCDSRSINDVTLRNVYKTRLSHWNGTYQASRHFGNRDPTSMQIHAPCNNQLLIENLCIAYNNYLWREDRIESKAFCIKDEMIRTCLAGEYKNSQKFGQKPYKLTLSNLEQIRKVLEKMPDENAEDFEYEFCENVRLENLEEKEETDGTCTCEAFEYKDQKRLSVNVIAVGFEPEVSPTNVNPILCKEKCII